MNKNHLILFILFFIGLRASGQTSSDRTMPDITGAYDRSQHGDPQGGAKLFVLKDHKYVIIFFGGLQIGTWNMDKDHMVKFVPTEPTQRFTLYGRYNKDLKSGSRICFMDFTTAETFIHPGNPGKGKPLMKRIFNKDLSCIKDHYVHWFEGTLPEVSFAYKTYGADEKEQDLKDIYTFQNADNYNDLVAWFYREEKTKKSFTAAAKNGRLYFSEDDSEEKRPLPDRREELDLINTVSAMEVNPEGYYFNPSYILYENDVKKDTRHYTYDAAKNAYISRIKPVKGYESKESFDVIYPFTAVKTVSVEKVPYIIDQVPLIIVKCPN